MRKFTAIGRRSPGILAAAAVAIWTSQAPAALNLVVTPIALTNPGLKTDWIGVKVQFVGVGGVTFCGFDLNFAGLHTFANPLGISGNLHQRLSITPIFDENSGAIIGTTSGPTPTGTFPTGPSTGLTDSFFGFNQTLLLSNPRPLFEDNNLANGQNPPFTQSPLNDIFNPTFGTGSDFGVGSVMTGAGVIANVNQPSTMNFAFIIMPKFGTMTFAGTFTDSIAQATYVDTTISPCLDNPSNAVCAAPEPASLLALTMAAPLVLCRRRRQMRRSLEAC